LAKKRESSLEALCDEEKKPSKVATNYGAAYFTSCAVYRAHWSTPHTLCTNSSRPLSAR
jgi:hypothetical protein